MKKIFSYILSSLLVLSLLFSCDRVEVLESETGYLSLDIVQDRSEDVVFKALTEEDPAFSVTIYDRYDQVVLAYADASEMPAEPIELITGPYRVVASSAPVGAAAFDAPFYSGEQEVVVTGSEVAATEVICTLANVKVTVAFEDDILNNFKSYVLTVTNGEGTLEYNAEKGTLNSEGYFRVTGTLTWTLTLVNNDGVQFRELTETYSDVVARQHYNFTFGLGEPDEIGGASVEMTVNNSENKKLYNLLLDFEAGVRPTMTSSYDLNREFSYPAGEPGSIIYYINIPGGISGLNILHLDNRLSTAGLPYNTNLYQLTESDIAWRADHGVLVDYIAEGDTQAQVDLTGVFKLLPIGDYQMEFEITSLNGKDRVITVTFSVTPSVEVEAVSVKTWAKFAFLNAKWLTDYEPEGISFQYRKQTESDWITFDTRSVDVNTSAKTYSAEVWGLEPSTPYVFRAVTTNDTETKIITFTTESAAVVPNMGFDLWYQSGGIWYPNKDASNFYWDTANGGSDAVGVYPTSKEMSHKVGGDAAALLESKSVALVGLAAGNIYTGKFVKAITSLSDPGAILNWGIPFSSRPLALKGWVDYRPGTINKTKAPYQSMSGKTDIGSIQIFLTDWAAPFQINTAKGTFVDFENDSAIIARGIIDVNATNSQYIEFTVPLVYSSTTRTPKYIVIAASASKYGDYFTGSTTSVMYVDEFSLVYDPEDLTSDELDKINYR